MPNHTIASRVGAAAALLCAIVATCVKREAGNDTFDSDIELVEHFHRIMREHDLDGSDYPFVVAALDPATRQRLGTAFESSRFIHELLLSVLSAMAPRNAKAPSTALTPSRNALPASAPADNPAAADPGAASDHGGGARDEEATAAPGDDASVFPYSHFAAHAEEAADSYPYDDTPPPQDPEAAYEAGFQAGVSASDAPDDLKATCRAFRFLASVASLMKDVKDIDDIDEWVRHVVDPRALLFAIALVQPVIDALRSAAESTLDADEDPSY